MADSSKCEIVVIGSTVVDLITYTAKLPTPGETIVGTDFQMGFGGKGANQCVAASRLGSKCAFVGKLGKDHGKPYRESLIEDGINVDHVKIEDNVITGVASIFVGEEDGQNIIVAVFGTNALVSPSFVNEAESTIASSNLVVVQLEIPTESSLQALRLAKKHSVKSVFNVAPGIKDLPKEMLTMPDILCLNETEAEIVTGMDKIGSKESAQQAIEKLKQDFGCGNSIIITLGAEGVFFWDGDKRTYHFVSAPKVSAVDCTGAGDCFVGTLAHCLNIQMKGDIHKTDLYGAVQQAVANASDSVLRRGTQYSFPRQLIPINANA